ncbi:MAG: NYN domain-containing protein, partial [bacterium]
LVTDMLALGLKHRIDQVVLVAGDSDFVPAVERLQDEGIKVILWHSPQESASNELLVVVDESYPISSAVLDLCAMEDAAPSERSEYTPRPAPASRMPVPVPEPEPEPVQQLSNAWDD